MRRGNAHKELRRKQAEERAAERAQRTPQQQLDLLDAKLGPGKGATRERARLATMVQSASKELSKKSDSSDKPKTRASRRAARNKRKAEQNN
tara:strand:- start:593 stop:868 length:276 start_codon:yes stop_codon:yes gene_type:complete